MPTEEAERVFERFYRADASRARSHGGSGLGLSIVSAIVGAHGGTVSAKSAIGEGMTVTVRLPVIAELPEAGDDGGVAASGSDGVVANGAPASGANGGGRPPQPSPPHEVDAGDTPVRSA
jgi:two-component system OmpR family sensor kinase